MPHEPDRACRHAPRGIDRDDPRDARVDRQARDERHPDAGRDEPLERGALVGAETTLGSMPRARSTLSTPYVLRLYAISRMRPISVSVGATPRSARGDAVCVSRT